jgi:hypothetical protein
VPRRAKLHVVKPDLLHLALELVRLGKKSKNSSNRSLRQTLAHEAKALRKAARTPPSPRRESTSVEDAWLRGTALVSWHRAAEVREPVRRYRSNRDGSMRTELGCEADLRALLVSSGSPHTRLRTMRRALQLMLDGEKPRGTKDDQTLHFAIWYAMERILDHSPDLEAIHARATLVAKAFRLAEIHDDLTADRVRQQYSRHFDRR